VTNKPITGLTRRVDEEEAEQVFRELKAYGYATVENFMQPPLVADLLSTVQDQWEQKKDSHLRGRPERDADDKLVYNLQNKDKKFVDVLSDPFVVKVCMHMLNDPYHRFLPADKPNYILNYYNARSSGQSLDLHIDTNIPARGDYTWVIQLSFLLNDMSEENGCTVVVPGSHQSGNFTDRSLKRVKPIAARAGDLVIWDSRMWHGTTANTSGRSRWALIASFSRWWVKQSMDITRGLPQDIYAELTDEQKSILGFCSIPPKNESDRINTKTGYDFLKPSVSDYFDQ
jgi:ectoine hydroxylase-related dioxygenase (phytanoyl-CoA dioxygenase family)